ncbi:MAG: hypothetical protein V4707_04290 [Pseudomonadota bacterium]
MSRPDLETEEGRAAYRKELRRVAWPVRWGGLGLILVGALFTLSVSRGMFGLPESAIVVGYGMVAVGWMLVIAAVFMRTRHHRQRLMEGL